MKMRHVTTSSVALVLLSGCLLGCQAMTDPGGSTRKAFEQDRTLIYTAEEFRSESHGPQEEVIDVIEAQGDIVLNEDGTTNTAESRLTLYTRIQADPSGKSAATGLDAVTAMGIAQSQMMANVTGLFLETVRSLVPVPGGVDAPDEGT